MWLETLVQCKGIHNFVTATTFTPRERRFLTNGLRFICTPPSHHLPTFIEQYLDDDQRGWQRFIRTITRSIINTQDQLPSSTRTPDNTDTPTSVVPRLLSKFRVRTDRTPAQRAAAHVRTHSQQQAMRPQFAVEMQQLDQYAKSTLTLLDYATKHDHHHSLVQHQRQNHSRADADFVRRLMSDESITIQPADKNLGLALVDTTWYHAELTRMLSDTGTYAKFSLADGIAIKNKHHALKSQEHMVELLLDHLEFMMKFHDATLMEWYGEVQAEQMLNYLKSRVTKKDAEIPTIYLLIKVHKPSGLCGRPIVPSTRWVTTPASVVVDHLLQEVMRAAKIPWLVKDTKTLVNEIEHNIRVPQMDSIHSDDTTFVTADIASLYTNIDTKLGLTLVQQFLELNNVSTPRIALIMDLLIFVMHNSYLTSSGSIYHQIDGTAMGTSCAVPYANIVVYMLERNTLMQAMQQGQKSQVIVYKRFLDDIWAMVKTDHVPAFISQLQSLHPKLRFECVTQRTHAVFLDLLIFKGHRFYSTGVFDLNVHQKSMNLYLYIPYHSFHPDAMKKSFIQTELMRYIRNTSDIKEYIKMKELFYSRLRDRGYPHKFLQPIFASIFYSDRNSFLLPSSEVVTAAATFGATPPRSQTLLRRLARYARQAQSTESLPPPVFIIPYNPLSRVIPTRRILLTNWSDLQSTTCLPPPIIAYQSQPSLVKRLVFGKAKRMKKLQEQKRTTPTKINSTQTSLLSFSCFKRQI